MRLLTLCLLVIASPSFAVECLDNEGRSVSWYFTYKFPGGYENAYHDVSSPP